MIDGFSVKNYRVLKEITLGKLWAMQKAKPLTPLVVVIGKNGVGKSSLFDAFGFLADVLELGAEEACDKDNRGGFDKLISSGANEPIGFEIYYRESPGARPITYELKIDRDDKGRPYIKEERLRQRRYKQKSGQPLLFLDLKDGRGLAWKGDALAGEGDEGSKVPVELTDNRRLGIASLSGLKDHLRIAQFRGFLGRWFLSYFTPDAARSKPMAGPQKRLSKHGDNLGNVVQFMERDHRDKFKEILENIAKNIPGINKIDTMRTEDGRLLLRFNDKGFQDPFYSQQMSDGTLKLFAYYLLLENPDPPSFICIEEPENGLYHKLLEDLAREFRNHATGEKNAPQIFVTTHQPYFVNAVSPEETWILEKGEDGFASIKNAADDPIVKGLFEEGLKLGHLWYSDYLDAR
ncbi:MAG: AAA family ATPase [Calditrichota bacterium]